MVGSYDGVIRLIHSASGQYVWYRVKVEVTNTDSSGEIKLNGPPAIMSKFYTPCFKDQVGQTFEVTIDGLFTTGKGTFTVENAMSRYEMVYCPLKKINHTGRISFVDTKNNK